MLRLARGLDGPSWVRVGVGVRLEGGGESAQLRLRLMLEGGSRLRYNHTRQESL